MANGWAPRTAEEFFTDLGRRQRMLSRLPMRQSIFIDDVAVDASVAPELSPLDSYVEGVDDEFPPPAPSIGDLPPSDVDTSDFEGVEFEESGPDIATRLSPFSTADRPDADAAGYGAVIIDTDLNLPLFSDGTVWKSFDGTVA